MHSSVLGGASDAQFTLQVNPNDKHFHKQVRSETNKTIPLDFVHESSLFICCAHACVHYIYIERERDRYIYIDRERKRAKNKGEIEGERERERERDRMERYDYRKKESGRGEGGR